MPRPAPVSFDLNAPSSGDPGTQQNWVGDGPPAWFGNGGTAPETPPPAGTGPRRRATDEVLERMPQAGEEAFGFKLVRELGRGAFGRVFLATQPDLGGRLVALKVSPDLAGEGRTLSRLQHTHIVPVYSTHRDGRFQAVCMPYYGAVTLADLLSRYREKNRLPATGRQLVETLQDLTARTVPDLVAQPVAAEGATPADPDGPAADALLDHLSRDSYPRAVCWLTARIADGLAHAHARNILHRDVKPANVLLTDDGQPMLLDFGIAEDLKLRAGLPSAPVGGTLPYMAPEQLAEVLAKGTPADGRSDVYSLGVVLYELLTGRYPFRAPSGTLADEVPRMLAERQAGPPPVRPHNPEVTPGLESIVRTCLAHDPGDRYQTAADLRDDLEHYLADEPLAVAPEPSPRERATKWARRHPRLSSNATLAALAGAVLVAGGYAYSARAGRLAGLESANTFRQFEADTRSVPFLVNSGRDNPRLVAAGLARARSALDRYALDAGDWDRRADVAALPAAEQTRLRKQLTDLCVLVARGIVVTAQAGPGDRADAYAEAGRWNQRAEAVAPGAPPRAVFAQRVKILRLQGDAAGAAAAAERAAGDGIEWTAEDHQLAGTDLLAEGRHADALVHFRAALKLDPQNFWAHLGEGAAHAAVGRLYDARTSFAAAVALAPDSGPGHYNRGTVHAKLGDYAAAEDDLTTAAESLPDFPELFLHRAAARRGLKLYPAAIRDLDRALELGAEPGKTHFLRAAVKRAAGDAAGATADETEALKTEPRDVLGWLERGQSRLARDLPGALADFGRALDLDPKSPHALLHKAFALNALGKPDDLIATLDQAVAADPKSALAHASRGLAHAQAARWDRAKADAKVALAGADGGPQVIYQIAATYARLAAADPSYGPRAIDMVSLAVKAGFGRDYLATDPEFAAVRTLPGFQELTRP